MNQSSPNSTLSSQNTENEETQKSDESEENTVDHPSEDEKNTKADIYNRLLSDKDAAIKHQKQTIEQGGTANDVQNPLSAIIFESNILETEYPQLPLILIANFNPSSLISVENGTNIHVPLFYLTNLP
ncbi:hypothetical protein [Enterococcus devriesei]|uniref:hypothetical protein n=1 Tax=Enterococcus devriesei TaxID=319970 RepID=UPI0028B22DAC|nr:hypothetical protein [Enterococcus devriesei]